MIHRKCARTQLFEFQISDSFEMKMFRSDVNKKSFVWRCFYNEIKIWSIKVLTIENVEKMH